MYKRQFLEFVNTLKDLIPLDGFSDPPLVDVAPSGLTAGFTLALPNVAVGVFNLSNISLGADVKVPFLGEAISVGFNFCTREKPFVLAVVMLGGGGWFLIRMSPKGLEKMCIRDRSRATRIARSSSPTRSATTPPGMWPRGRP